MQNVRSQYPAILIGQLCVFDGFGYNLVKEHVSDEMMDLIKTMAINPDNDSAARYIVVDAVNQSNVIDSYKRNGFDFLFESDEEELECLRGYENLKNQEPLVNDSNGFSENKRKPICKTRLMWFDLILLKQ